MRKRISAARPAVKTRVVISNKETGEHEVQVSMDGKNYRPYKSGLTLDAATKETTSINGHYTLWNKIIDNRK
jgi:hypothetical protein